MAPSGAPVSALTTHEPSGSSRHIGLTRRLLSRYWVREQSVPGSALGSALAGYSTLSKSFTLGKSSRTTAVPSLLARVVMRSKYDIWGSVQGC